MTVSEKHMAEAKRVAEGSFLHGGSPIIDAIAAALDAAGREGMRRAVQIIREGYPRPVAIPYRRDGKPSNHDKCAHHFYMIEDCEECAIAAILSQAGEA